MNHARRIIDLAGKLSATVAKRRNPKIFDTLTFMNGNLEREGVGAGPWRRGKLQKIRKRRSRLADGGCHRGIAIGDGSDFIARRPLQYGLGSERARCEETDKGDERRLSEAHLILLVACDGCFRDRNRLKNLA